MDLIEHNFCSPIGIFDSGVGGLSVLKALKNILKSENYIYFGDTKRVPYGVKSKETILEYAKQDINFLVSKKCKIVVAACGTVSSYLNILPKNSSVDVIGVIAPTCKVAVNSTKNKKIGVMCTEAAAKSGAYKSEINKIDSSCQVFTIGCPKLVPIIETGNIYENNEKLIFAVKKYVDMLLSQNVDTIILGCTHYPLIKDIIKKVSGKDISIIDSGEETAKFVKEYIQKTNLNTKNSKLGKCDFFVSGCENQFSSNAKLFLKEDISDFVKKVHIEDEK
ncbi:MAG: glutamate racemase [Clostridia bacterium]|nr:glutamate racemase [Clostridia bacterium]